jgi:hypothetical protein
VLVPPFTRMLRRPGAFGVALTLYDVWRRLPAAQRKRILDAARTHGPRVASRAYELRRRPPRRP